MAKDRADDDMAEWGDIDKVRADFPILDAIDIAYLDNAATTQKPRCVMDAESEYYSTINANPFRGLYGISVETTEAYEAVRARVAKFVNAAAPEEVVFTRNATESLNLLAYSLGDAVVEAGDEIVTSVMEHHSNMLPWQALAKRKGATVRYLEPDARGIVTPDCLRAALNPKVKIVALTAMSNVFGSANDVAALAECAHANGSVFVVDGAQSVPHSKTDVQAMGADFLAFSAHKMLGPMGVGVLYGRGEWLERIPPFMTGGEMIETVTLERGPVFSAPPHKFEAGTVNVGGAIAFGAALDYVDRIGVERIEAREAMLTARAFESLARIPHVSIVGSDDPADHHAILSFKVDDVHPHDVSAILSEDGIGVRAGHHCAQPLHKFIGVPSTTRASFMFYNTCEEIERFAASVASVRKRMGYAS